MLSNQPELQQPSGNNQINSDKNRQTAFRTRPLMGKWPEKPRNPEPKQPKPKTSVESPIKREFINELKSKEAPGLPPPPPLLFHGVPGLLTPSSSSCSTSSSSTVSSVPASLPTVSESLSDINLLSGLGNNVDSPATPAMFHLDLPSPMGALAPYIPPPPAPTSSLPLLWFPSPSPITTQSNCRHELLTTSHNLNLASLSDSTTSTISHIPSLKTSVSGAFPPEPPPLLLDSTSYLPPPHHLLLPTPPPIYATHTFSKIPSFGNALQQKTLDSNSQETVAPHSTENLIILPPEEGLHPEMPAVLDTTRRELSSPSLLTAETHISMIASSLEKASERIEAAVAARNSFNVPVSLSHPWTYAEPIDTHHSLIHSVDGSHHAIYQDSSHTYKKTETALTGSHSNLFPLVGQVLHNLPSALVEEVLPPTPAMADLPENVTTSRALDSSLLAQHLSYENLHRSINPESTETNNQDLATPLLFPNSLKMVDLEFENVVEEENAANLIEPQKQADKKRFTRADRRRMKFEQWEQATTKRIEQQIDQIPCFRCKVCRFLSLKKSSVQDHIQATHPNLLTVWYDVDSENSSDEDQGDPDIQCLSIDNRISGKPDLPEAPTQEMTFVSNSEEKTKSVESEAQYQQEAPAPPIRTECQSTRLLENPSLLKQLCAPITNIPKLKTAPIPQLEATENDRNTEAISRGLVAKNSTEKMPLAPVVVPMKPCVKIEIIHGMPQLTVKPVQGATVLIPVQSGLPKQPARQITKTSDKKFLPSSGAFDKSAAAKTVKKMALKRKAGRPKESKTTGVTLLRKKLPPSEINEDELGYRCLHDGCPIRLRSIDNLEYHRRCHAPLLPGESGPPQSPLYRCPECNQPFDHWKMLSLHLWRIHTVDMELYSCDKCGYKTYSLAKLIKTHLQIHSNERPYLCDTCGKGFKTNKQLRNHKAIHKDHHKRKPISFGECEICHRSFSDRRLLRTHMDTVHKKMRPFLCNFCGYAASSRSSLKMHIRQHTGEKPFSCDMCEYRTADHNSLRRHKMRHSGEKRYTCPFCPYACIQSSTYKSHLNNKHPGMDSGITFSCNLCTFCTIREDSYVTHMAEHKKIPANRAESKAIKIGPMKLEQPMHFVSTTLSKADVLMSQRSPNQRQTVEVYTTMMPLEPHPQQKIPNRNPFPVESMM